MHVALKDSFIIANIKSELNNQLANFMPIRYFGLRIGYVILQPM